MFLLGVPGVRGWGVIVSANLLTKDWFLHFYQTKQGEGDPLIHKENGAVALNDIVIPNAAIRKSDKILHPWSFLLSGYFIYNCNEAVCSKGSQCKSTASGETITSPAIYTHVSNKSNLLNIAPHYLHLTCQCFFCSGDECNWFSFNFEK